MLVAALLSISIETKCEENPVVLLEEEEEGNCTCTEDRDIISFILLILELNLVVWVDFLGERNSNAAMAELKKVSETTSNVMRDGQWTKLPKRELVPGDIVALVLGSTIPADGKIACHVEHSAHGHSGRIKLDCAAITGESMPESKEPGDSVLAGTTVVAGEAEMEIERTGGNSSIGEAQQLVQGVGEKRGALREMLHALALAITLLAAVTCVIIFTVIVVRDRTPIPQAVKLIFVLLVASLPVAMPIVVTTGLAVGAQELLEDEAVVQRLSAIEELAGVDILCSDKTGTLTLGKMSVAEAESVAFGRYNSWDLHLMTLLATRREVTDAIDAAITESSFAQDLTTAIERYEELDFEAFNPETKRASARIRDIQTGNVFRVSKGAPEAISSLPGIGQEAYEISDDLVVAQAKRGFKTLMVATTTNGGNDDDEDEQWDLIGCLSIIDPPRHDTKDTIDRAKAQGVQIKMITGDQVKIAKEVARQLGLGTNIFGSNIWLPNSKAMDTVDGLGDLSELADGFASMAPKHKFKVVKALQERGHVVGMTGDGVNDSPALAVANVGIAVAGASDAARGASDIYLTREGLSTIVKAISRSRQIFRRLESYVIYRIASSILILLFFFISIVGFEFRFPTWTLILLSIVNDCTVMATSKDNVRSSKAPLKWEILRLCSVAAVIGGIAVLQSILLLAFLKDGASGSSEWLGSIGFASVNETCELVAIIYLDLGISIILNIFCARNRSAFFFQFVTESKEGVPLSWPKANETAAAMVKSGQSSATVIERKSSLFTSSVLEVLLTELKESRVDDISGKKRTKYTGERKTELRYTTYWFCAPDSFFSDAAPLPSLVLLVPVICALVLATVVGAMWDENIKLGGGDPMKVPGN